MDLKELEKRRKRLKNDATHSIANMQHIVDENIRVAAVARDAEMILNEIEQKFEEVTGLDALDVKFLFFATALQCVRQYWLSNEKMRFKTDQQSSRMMKKYYPISLLGPVPYDAFKKSGFTENTGLSGANHRITAIGHDPLLGWIFGTANILSETLTKNNLILESYKTDLIGNEYKISGPSHIGMVFSDSIVRVNDNPADLALAVTKHALHLKSDAFTKMGLPIPIINSVSPVLTSTLLKNGIDAYSVSRGMQISNFINLLISSIHSLFYDETRYASQELYEVKTRKIIMYSNAIASMSNLIYVALRAYLGDKKSLKKLDVGGLIVTIYRLVQDNAFIQAVKEEFVFGEFQSRIENNNK